MIKIIKIFMIDHKSCALCEIWDIETHIEERRGLKVDGLGIQDGLKVLQAVVDAIQVVAEFRSGQKNASV